MEARFRSWWQKIKIHPYATGFVVLFVLIACGLVVYFGWDWTGFNGGYSQITITSTNHGTTTATVKPPGKTLWDWLQLLFIPAVLAVAGYVINLTISRGEQEATKQRAQSEREAAEKRAETEREIALDNQREAALQAYIDKMSELLLHEKLRESQPEEEVRTIAHVRTLTVLPRLDGKRKGSVLRFLQESGLIDKDKRIIDLHSANLVGADLEGGTSSDLLLGLGADLSKADLSSAILSGANLYGADLRNANLVGTDLDGANLYGASLGEASMEAVGLWGADLRYAALWEADLHSANIDNTDLRNANLRNANLREALLRGSDLSGADLSGADLWRAFLGGSDLSGANLSEAILEDANLEGANLKDVIGITIEQLAKAKSLKDATMPDGSIHP